MNEKQRQDILRSIVPNDYFLLNLTWAVGIQSRRLKLLQRLSEIQWIGGLGLVSLLTKFVTLSNPLLIIVERNLQFHLALQVWDLT